VARVPQARAPSTPRRAGTSQVSDEAARGRLDQIEHFLEAVRAAVIRIRNLVCLGLWRELEKQTQPLVTRARCTPLQHPQVVAVHGQDQVEALEIAGLDDAGPQRVQVVTAALGRLAGAHIRRLADVIAGGARGVDLELQVGRLARGQRAQHTLRGW
jgi:hypothetical protein